MARARQAQLRPFSGSQKAVEVCLEVVDPAVHQRGRIEDAVPAMHDVIVEGNHHQCRVGDDAAELAGVEGGVLHRLTGAQVAEPRKRFVGSQDLDAGSIDRHGRDCSTFSPRPDGVTRVGAGTKQGRTKVEAGSKQ